MVENEIYDTIKHLSKLIEDIAYYTRMTFGIKTRIKDMRKAAIKMGFKIIEETNIEKINTIEKISDKNIRIFIEKKELEKQNRDIAIMLGMAILNMGYIVDKDRFSKHELNKKYRFDKNTDYSNATMFANSFLMPKEKFIKIISKNTKNNKVNMKKVARYFNVSIQDATNRAIQLRVMEW